MTKLTPNKIRLSVPICGCIGEVQSTLSPPDVTELDARRISHVPKAGCKESSVSSSVRADVGKHRLSS